MLKGLTWEEETHARIERAKAEQAKAKELYEHWTNRVDALERALRLEVGGLNGSRQQKDLTLMSVNKALIEIAKEHGGLVVTRDAIETLMKAGVFFTRGEANDNIHSTLRRSKDFRKARRGVYKLIESDERSQYKAEPHESLSNIVFRLTYEHPEWDHRQLVNGVVQTGYDFQGKNPGLAVNMAVQHLKRVAKRSKSQNPDQQQPMPLEAPATN